VIKESSVIKKKDKKLGMKDRQAEADRQTDIHTGRQMDRKTDRHMYRQTVTQRGIRGKGCQARLFWFKVFVTFWPCE
jgi:hypothetical protein